MLEATRQTKDQNSAAVALAKLQAQHEMVDYDEGRLVEDMVREIDLKKQFEKVKQEQELLMINTQKQGVEKLYED